MKEKDLQSIDADVITACGLIKQDDAIIYLRTNGESTTISYSGELADLVNAVLTCMHEYDDFYEVVSAAIALYEEHGVRQN